MHFYLIHYDPLRRVASATSGCAGFASISCKGVTPPSHRDRTITNREHYDPQTFINVYK